MNKKEFLSKYPEIKQSTLENYLQAIKDKNLNETVNILLLFAMLCHDGRELSGDLTSVCEYYEIDYIYSEEWE